MRLGDILSPSWSIPSAFNLHLSIPVIILTYFFTSIVKLFFSEISTFAFVLFFATLLHSQLVNIVYKEEIASYTEKISGKPFALFIKNRVGTFTGYHIISNLNMLVSFLLIGLLFLLSTGPINWATYILLAVTIMYLVDPLVAMLLQSDKTLSKSSANLAVTSCGYLSILLIGVGSIPAEMISVNWYPYVLSFGLVSARLAFLTNFAFDKREDLVVFGPSILALVVAVLPNLKVILSQF
tara:strand:+ start:225 stop:941 length:717 start_codon:yes stop_codon:yes gene_type:complete